MAERKLEIFEGMVRATSPGYASGAVRARDEVFFYQGPLGSWMEKVSAGPDKAAKPVPKAKDGEA
jgi:hypothetical protein